MERSVACVPPIASSAVVANLRFLVVFLGKMIPQRRALTSCPSGGG